MRSLTGSHCICKDRSDAEKERDAYFNIPCPFCGGIGVDKSEGGDKMYRIGCGAGEHWVQGHESHRGGTTYTVRGHCAKDPKITAHDRSVDRRNVRLAEEARRDR